MKSAADHCQSFVRESDRDRYLASLFAGDEIRRGLFALYAFNTEVSRVREIVSDPLPGEIRLQWWRDALEGEGHGVVESHPVLAELRWAIGRFNLPVVPLLNLIEARIFDLYDDPMPSLNDLEGYTGETSSALIQLASIVLANGEDPGTGEVAGHAGIAYAVTGLLRALPIHAARRQMFLPADVLKRHGVEPEEIFQGRTTPQLKSAVEELRLYASDHLLRTRSLIGCVGRKVIPAFLPVCLVEPHLQRMKKKSYDPLRDFVELSPLKRQWMLWRAWKQACKSCRHSL